MALESRNKNIENGEAALVREDYAEALAFFKAAVGAILIDLHTYPAEPWIIERHAQGARPEIDIGFTEGLTPPLWVSALSKHFHQHGYDVGHNTPYAGVIDAGAKAAVMIEIRRDVVGRPNGPDPKWERLIDALRSMPVGG
jgi:hypothetical protein